MRTGPCHPRTAPPSVGLTRVASFGGGTVNETELSSVPSARPAVIVYVPYEGSGSIGYCCSALPAPTSTVIGETRKLYSGPTISSRISPLSAQITSTGPL